MKARGYGLKRRTTFHLFHFDSRDLRFFCGVMILFGVCVIARAFGHGTMEFYPRMDAVITGQSGILLYILFGMLAFLPAILEGKEALSMALLRFDKVSFAYPDAKMRALDQVSFSMEEGEYLVVCGESGCGKTTLLRQAKPELTPAGARDGSVYYHGSAPCRSSGSESQPWRSGMYSRIPTIRSLRIMCGMSWPLDWRIWRFPPARSDEGSARWRASSAWRTGFGRRLTNCPADRSRC